MIAEFFMDSPRTTQFQRWLLSKAAIRAKDAAKYSPALRNAAAGLWYFRGSLSSGVRRSVLFARALAMAESGSLRQRCIEAIKRGPGFEDAAHWTAVLAENGRYRRILRDQPTLDRSILLKAHGPHGEKGVLLMTFEYNWARLLLGLSDDEFRWLDDRYDLVLSTSWSPTDYAALACAVSRTRGPVFVQSCNHGEIAAIERFHERLKCLPVLPCDWLNPALYASRPFEERATDIVMVANWGEFKRHWELFAALSKMPPHLRIVLIGQNEPGRTVETILALAKQFGARQPIETHVSIPIAEVARHQCNAKVSVIMTRREGCCVAAVESLFAGCALAMRADAHVGPLAYINEQTGARLRPGRIAEDLMALLSRAKELAPREWAEANVAGIVSWRKVNAILARSAMDRGLPWTRDIALPQWRPHPTFARREEQDAMRPAYAELHQRFPKVFSTTLADESWR